MNDRNLLLKITADSLTRLGGEALIKPVLDARAIDEPCIVIAIGKAAGAMACGVLDVLARVRIRYLLVVTRQGYLQPWQQCLKQAEAIESGHPLPDAHSLAAGKRLIQILDRYRGERFLFLLSGGASSLVEVLPEHVTLDDLQRANQWLLASGLPINTVNAIRSRLSLIKGGKLLARLGPARGEVLLMSDVSGDDPAVIGSGLLYPLRADVTLPASMPAWLRRLCVAQSSDVNPKPLPYTIIANLDTARTVFAGVAKASGLTVTVMPGELSGDAEAVAATISAFLLQAAPGLYIWGGETTVRLPRQPGRGGRNQHLALAAAMALAGRPGVYLLAIGTDGSDGNSGDAGALVDGQTLSRGETAGLRALDCLRGADAGRFLETSGDLVHTGPTGCNLRDLVIALKR